VSKHLAPEAGHRLTAPEFGCDHAPAMGAPRTVRGGGGRRWRALAVALAAVSLFVVQVAPASADPDEDRLAQLAREKQELERAIQVSRQNADRYAREASKFQQAVNAANARIGTLAAQQRNAQTEADSLKIEIEIAEEQLALVGFQLTETATLIDSLRAEAAANDQQLAKRQQLYAAHMRTTYLQAQISPLEMLLSSASITQFADRVQAMVLINRQDQRLVSDIRTLKASTSAKQTMVAQKEQEIVGLKEQITKQRGALATKKTDYERIVAEMKASITTQAGLRYDAQVNKNAAAGAQQQASSEVAKLNRDLERTEAAYAALAAELAARSGLGAFTGRMAIWPVNGTVSSRFGARWGGFHNGLDIAAPMYTPLRAAAAGTVVTVGKPYLAYGDRATVVIIAHGSNFSSLYGHMADNPGPTVRVGQQVGAGTVIGYIGMTGWTTGPHVHFMTIVNGRAVDPLPYLP
jgi:murein DD-endopeptidase MepM/ murein hydrolase activator NlpD